MKIDEVDRKIIAVTELNADRSIEEVADLTELQPHVIQYRLKRMEGQGILGQKRPSINRLHLGFQYQTLFFSLRADSEKKRTGLLREILEVPGVYWAGEIGGDFQYAISVCAKTVPEMFKIFQQINSFVSGVLVRKSITTRLSGATFSRGYLSDLALKTEPLIHEFSDTPVGIDDIDRRILSEMANAKYSSERDLSRRLAMSVSTVNRRIRILEEKEVIAGYYYAIDAFQLGMLVYNLLISTSEFGFDLKQELYRIAQNHRHIVNVMHCMGEWDFHLTVEVDTPEKTSQISRDLLDCTGGVIDQIRIVPVFRFLKVSMFPFR